VSDEQEDKIEKTFIDGLGAKYPMAKIKASDTQKYGIKFYPSVYCIAPDGTVHSVPDDRMPSTATIESLLEDVSLAPKMPADSRYDNLRKMWEKGDYRRLDAYLAKMLLADKLDAEMREVFQGQQALLEKKAAKQAARVTSAAQGPDYLRARQTLEKIAKEWKGFAAADAAAVELKRFSKDSQIKKEIAASKALAKLEAKYDPSRISQRRKLIDALGKFADKHRGTYAGEQAQKKLRR
jgi:hypothetical protein